MAFIGIANMAFGIDFHDYDIATALWVNIAVSMMTVLYSLFMIVFIFEPIVYILKKNRNL
jgi:ABC-type transport system involved in cytochrome c biogenesis permease subunit